VVKSYHLRVKKTIAGGAVIATPFFQFEFVRIDHQSKLPCTFSGHVPHIIIFNIIIIIVQPTNKCNIYPYTHPLESVGHLVGRYLTELQKLCTFWNTHICSNFARQGVRSFRSNMQQGCRALFWNWTRRGYFVVVDDTATGDAVVVLVCRTVNKNWKKHRAKPIGPVRVWSNSPKK